MSNSTQKCHQIKIIGSMLNTKSTFGQTTRYRSVKVKLNRQNCNSTQLQSLPKHKYLPYSTKHSNFRSRRHPSDFSALNLNLTDFRDQKAAADDLNPQDKTNRKPAYIDTFHFMLSMQKNKHNAKQKAQQESMTARKRQSRVLLPALNELDSHFTVLDNIHLPINYINEEIKKLHKELKSDTVELQSIRSSIKEIHKARVKQIADIEETGDKGIKKLKDLLKNYRVHHQQSVMRHKSSYDKCIDYLPEYGKELEITKDRLVKLQDTIFKDMPFELQQNQEELSVLTNQYF